MAETTEISWAHSTFNPWIGCTKVSPGCDHCYAERDMAIRRGRVEWGAGAARSRTSEAYWKQPLTWDRKAKASGQPWRVFCASLADVFDNEVPDQWRADLWALIAATPNLTWMLLTKRIGNVTYPMPHNVWLGITVVNQEEAQRDIPKLLRADAGLRWLSCEPLLGPLDLEPFFDRGAAADNGRREFDVVDWVIVGGESGPHARPMYEAWSRSIRDQCANYGVPFHFKQWGGVRPKDGGHLLEGREHRAFPA
jgi:protein gp37